jgi:hypothetical protein
LHTKRQRNVSRAGDRPSPRLTTPGGFLLDDDFPAHFRDIFERVSSDRLLREASETPERPIYG